MRSHAELDQAKDLDAGDPAELGRQYRQLRRRFGHLTVLGGCCAAPTTAMSSRSVSPARRGFCLQGCLA
jgi:hypothetical protein